MELKSLCLLKQNKCIKRPVSDGYSSTHNYWFYETKELVFVEAKQVYQRWRMDIPLIILFIYVLNVDTLNYVFKQNKYVFFLLYLLLNWVCIL